MCGCPQTCSEEKKTKKTPGNDDNLDQKKEETHKIETSFEQKTLTSETLLPSQKDLNRDKEKEKLRKEEIEKIKNDKEFDEKRKKLEREKEQLLKEKKIFLDEKKIHDKEKLEEEEKRKIEEEKRLLEKQKMEFEQRKQWEEIERKKKEVDDIKRKIEEDRKREEEAKKYKEKEIQIQEEKAKMEEEMRKEIKRRNREKEKQKNREAKDFYDCILDFSSFEQLKKEGWNANFTKLGKKKFEKCIKENNIVIGILGNKNRGKSYLLGRILKMKEYENPNGFLVTTSGISCIFPKLEKNDNTFITLDSAGKDNPLLQNVFFDAKDKNELIRNIARDQKVTEIALSDFIIQESDVLIAVLEQLSFNEQEMLKNLINQLVMYGIKNTKNNCLGKRLIVIHNLMNLSTIKDIKDFINGTLLKSLTFTLETQIMTKLNINIYIQDINQFGDKNNKSKPIIEIIHVIVGNDLNEEIRKTFNEPAFEFIRKHIITEVGKKFNILERFRNFIIENSKNYLEGKPFNENSLIIGTETEKEGKIVVPITLSPEMKNNKIVFKKFYINARGIHNFSSALEPKYSTDLIEINNNLFIDIEFELPGKVEIDEKSYVVEKDQYIFTIKGKIYEEESKEIREFEFQPIINRYIPCQNDKNKEQEIIINQNKNDKNKEQEIIINQNKNSEMLVDTDEEFGIYNIKIPITTYIKNTLASFQESEDDDDSNKEDDS